MKLGVGILSSILPWCISPALGGTYFYAISNDGTQPNNIFRISTADLANPVFIAPIGVVDDVGNAAMQSSTAVYGLSDSDALFVIDTADGSVATTITLDVESAIRPRGIDQVSSGTLYGVFPGGATGTQLRTIDPTTGNTTLVTEITGVSTIEAIAFAPDDRLFAVGAVTGSASTTLFVIDYLNPPTLGQATMVRAMNVPPLGPTNRDIDALTFGPDGFLYATNSIATRHADLYRINPTTGDLTNLGSTGVFGLNGLAAAPDRDQDGLPDEFENGSGIFVSAINTGSDPDDPDSDDDGLRDDVEVLVHGSNPNLADSDGDGFDDPFEISTGFDPAHASSTPDTLSSIRTAVEFRFNAANGETYKIEGSTNLEVWIAVETGIGGNGGVVTRFYSTEGIPFRAFRARRE